MLQLHAGDPVAVVKFQPPPVDTMTSQQATVIAARAVYIEISDGRFYFSSNGQGFGKAQGTLIVPIAKHRARSLPIFSS
jgi:hypothetical protein